MEHGHKIYATSGFQIARPLLQSIRAETALEHGDPDYALTLIDDALDVQDETGEALILPSYILGKM